MSIREIFQFVGWRNFVLDVIHKTTYGFEIVEVNRQNIPFNKTGQNVAGTACSFLAAKFV